MSQFGKIYKFELQNYAKNKAFVGVTLFLVAAIALVMFFPRIANLFASQDTSDTAVELPVMLVRIDDPVQADRIKETFSAAFKDYTVQITEDETNVIKDQISAGDVNCAFVLSGDTAFTYYVNNLSMYDQNADTASGVLRQVYQMNAMLNGGMSAEEAADAMGVQIDGKIESIGKNQIQNYFYTYIMIMALYMVIMLYGQMVAMSVATEKSSRAMEVLITSAKPLNMMFGKVFAACTAGLVQLIAIFGSALVFYNMNKSVWGDNLIINSLFNIPLSA